MPMLGGKDIPIYYGYSEKEPKKPDHLNFRSIHVDIWFSLVSN